MTEMFKRVFSRRQPVNKTKSIRITKMMEVALNQLAEKQGLTLNAYIVFRLDQMLQIELKKGNLTMPAEEPESLTAS